MDVDAFVAVNARRWDRLKFLLQQRKLSGAQVDELVNDYQTTATHLSQLQSAAPDPTLTSRLSALLARARSAMTGAHELSWSDVVRFAAISLPAAFYRVRWWTIWVGVAFIVLALVSGWWTYNTPEALAQMGTPTERANYAQDAFESYYSNYPAPDFMAQVWLNNAWISAQAVGGGPTGVFPIYVLVVNATGVGGAGAIMAEHGMLDVFFGLILPHGLMELTAVFVAIGAGLKLFWSMVAPGDKTRMRSLVDEVLSIIIVAIGLIFVLGVSGIVEAYVTPSALPVGIKITIGALVLAAYWIYTFVLGRRAVADGETGQMRGELLDDRVATAA